MNYLDSETKKPKKFLHIINRPKKSTTELKIRSDLYNNSNKNNSVSNAPTSRKEINSIKEDNSIKSKNTTSAPNRLIRLGAIKRKSSKKVAEEQNKSKLAKKSLQIIGQSVNSSSNSNPNQLQKETLKNDDSDSFYSQKENSNSTIKSRKSLELKKLRELKQATDILIEQSNNDNNLMNSLKKKYNSTRKSQNQKNNNNNTKIEENAMYDRLQINSNQSEDNNNHVNQQLVPLPLKTKRKARDTVKQDVALINQNQNNPMITDFSSTGEDLCSIDQSVSSVFIDFWGV